MPEQLAPLAEWTLDYIQGLPRQEFDWLDYKRSDWLTLDADCLDKLSCYLSAWANYEGGYLVIGVEISTGDQALSFDQGVELNAKGGIKDWLEDKLPTLVDDPLDKIEVSAIPFSETPERGVVVIRVPSSARAPHQARNRRFYTRLGSKLYPLPKGVVFDIANRQKHPRVSSVIRINFFEPDIRENSALIWEVVNESDVFCRYVAVDITIPLRVGRTFMSFEDAKIETNDAGETFWTMRVGNGINRPLFPRAIIRRTIKAKLVSKITDNSGEIIRQTIVQITARTYADGAPYVDQTFTPAEVIKILSPNG